MIRPGKVGRLFQSREGCSGVGTPQLIPVEIDQLWRCSRFFYRGARRSLAAPPENFDREQKKVLETRSRNGNTGRDTCWNSLCSRLVRAFKLNAIGRI